MSKILVSTKIVIDGIECDLAYQQPHEGNGGQLSKSYIYTDDEGKLCQINYATKWGVVELEPQQRVTGQPVTDSEASNV